MLLLSLGSLCLGWLCVFSIHSSVLWGVGTNARCFFSMGHFWQRPGQGGERKSTCASWTGKAKGVLLIHSRCSCSRCLHGLSVAVGCQEHAVGCFLVLYPGSTLQHAFLLLCSVVFCGHLLFGRGRGFDHLASVCVVASVARTSFYPFFPSVLSTSTSTPITSLTLSSFLPPSSSSHLLPPHS